MTRRAGRYDVLVIGAGPAGLAAAHAAASQGLLVAVVDDNPRAGGQIWRGGPAEQGERRAAALWAALQAEPTISWLLQTRVLMPLRQGQLLVQDGGAAQVLEYDKLILATGARERLLPFPGWTLPGVTGAGGLQALAKGGLPLAGKRVVVAGSGPLLLAAAATLRQRGARLVAIVEQAGRPALARLGLGLLATPSKLVQALGLARQLRGVPYLHDSYVCAAETGIDSVAGALHLRLRSGGREGGRDITLDCDYLACGYGLQANTELAQALDCGGAGVPVDQWQQSRVPHIYCAGEGRGVGGAGGVELALVEGRIAGLAACGQLQLARRHFAERARWQGFAARLERAFALRPEVAGLADDDTIVCRCEDVRHGELRQHASWRSAKLHTRCGMGPCQGRVCGGATALLYGWRPGTVRQPLAPARIDSIIAS